MLIKEVRVARYRSIASETLPCEPLTILVGANGAGKSTFLRAIEIFFSSSPRVTEADFFGGDSSSELAVSLTFGDLSPTEFERFAAYVQDGHLTVERVLRAGGSRVDATYYGSRLQNPDFSTVRTPESAAAKKTAYETLRASAEYSALPKWTKQEQGLAALRDWEVGHPERCERMRDEGHFFGFKEVAQGYLGQRTRFVYVPAVRDVADDVVDSRGSPITELVDLVVRASLSNREDFVQLRTDIQQRYDEVMSPGNLKEVELLSGDLDRTLKDFVQDASVAVGWSPGGPIDLPLPKANVRLTEDGHETDVGRVGHGLQRAFLFSLLQHLAVAQSHVTKATDGDHAGIHLILAIEEPELYQHPSRQRHFAELLYRMAAGTSGGIANTQILYSTHSPLFLGLDRFDQIRVAAKEPSGEGKPRQTKLRMTTLNDVATDLWIANGSVGPQFTRETLVPRLMALMTPWMNEGFFARTIVLVEGEDDRAALVGTADALGYRLEAAGVTVIPCGGKVSMDRPAVIFRRLKIPVFAVWDSDEGKKGANPDENRRLLRLFEATPEDWPHGVYAEFACFRKNLEAVMRAELGEDWYDTTMADVCQIMGLASRSLAFKNPAAVSEVIRRGLGKDRRCETMHAILQRALDLANWR